MVLWRPIRPFRTNTSKRCPFHYRGLECKSRKSRNTWSNRKFGPGVQSKGGQRLTEFCQENALIIANALFQQHKRRLYTWTSPDGQHWNQIDYILWSQRWRSSIWSMNYALCLKNMDGGSWHCIGDREQDHPQEKEIQKSKMAVWEGLTKHHYKQS